MKKRIISLLLAAAMILSMLPTVFAEEAADPLYEAVAADVNEMSEEAVPATAEGTCVAWLDTDDDGVIDSDEAAFSTLDEAFLAVGDAAAADNVIIKMNADVDLGNMTQYIGAGVFTLDLNGKTISNDRDNEPVISITGGSITITDSDQGGAIVSSAGFGVGVRVWTLGSLTVTGGTITGNTGVEAHMGNLTVEGGEIIGNNTGIGVYGGVLTVEGGTVHSDCNALFAGTARTNGIVYYGDITVLDGEISGEEEGIEIANGCSVSVHGGVISGKVNGVYSAGMTTITGGTFNGNCGVRTTNGTLTISGGTFVGEHTAATVDLSGNLLISGGTFIGSWESVEMHCGSVSITGGSFKYDPSRYVAYGCTVTEESATGMWIVGGTPIMFSVALSETENGTVTADKLTAAQGEKVSLTVMADEGYVLDSLTVNGEDVTVDVFEGVYSFAMSASAVEISASFTEFIPGYHDVAAWIDSDHDGEPDSDEMRFAYLQDAVDAAADAVESDDLVIRILRDVNVGNATVSVQSGVFTLDLNGKVIRSSVSTSNAIQLRGGTVTVTDSDLDGRGRISSKIMNGMDIRGGELKLAGGTVEGFNSGISVRNTGSAVIMGGAVTSANVALYVYNGGSVVIMGGAIIGETSSGIIVEADSSVAVSGGTVTGNRGVDIYGSGIATITGGTIIGNEFAGIGVRDGGSLTVTDGTVSGNMVGMQIRRNGSALISGGTVTGNHAGAVVEDNGSLSVQGGTITGSDIALDVRNASATVTGGSFSHDPSEYVDYGYLTVYNSATGLWYVLTETFYAISFSDSVNGIVTGPVEAYGQQTVTLRVIPADGYKLDTLTVMQGETPVDVIKGKANKYTFTMPAGDITVSATFTTSEIYAITVADNLENGSITAPETAYEGHTVSLNVVPAAGYAVEGLTVMQGETPVEVAADYSFEMPAGDVTVSAVFRENTALVLELADVYSDSWNGNYITVALWDGETETVLRDNISVWEGGLATYTLDVPSSAVLRFYWNQGEFPEECSFTITRGGKLIYAASGNDCAGFANGMMFFESDPAAASDPSKAVAWLDSDNDGEIDDNEDLFGSMSLAFAAVANATEEDHATVRMLKDVDLGDGYLMIYSGAFTLDLNGKAIRVSEFCVNGGTVTITDTSADQLGSISGDWNTLYVDGGTVIMQGGTILSNEFGVHVTNGNLTVTGGSIIGRTGCAIFVDEGNVTITGGDFYTENGHNRDVYLVTGTLSVTDGMFQHGVQTYRGFVSVTGGSFLADPSAYIAQGCVAVQNTETGVWTVSGSPEKFSVTMGEMENGRVAANKTAAVQGETVALRIHANSGYELDTLLVNGEDVTLGVLNGTYTFGMAAQDTVVTAIFRECVPGVSDVVAWADIDNDGDIDDNEQTFQSLDEALWYAADEAADHIVIKLNKSVNIGQSMLNANGGLFTLDLNGKTIAGSTRYTNGVLTIRHAEVTITDSDPEGKGAITGVQYGVFVEEGGTLILDGGTITGGFRNAITVAAGNLVMNGGKIFSDQLGVTAWQSSNVTINGGEIDAAVIGLELSNNANGSITGGIISCDQIGVRVENGCSMEISGGTITAGNGALDCWDQTIVTGGSFSHDPSQFTTENYTVSYNDETGLWDVVAAVTYKVDISETANGTVTVDKPDAVAGATVTLTVAPEVGYKLDTLSVMQGDAAVPVTKINAITYEFVMPAADVTVSAAFTAAELYTITVDPAVENGTVTLPETAYDGSLVIPVIMPAAGYILESLSVMQGEMTVDMAADGSFEMPAGDVTVSAVFVQADVIRVEMQDSFGDSWNGNALRAVLWNGEEGNILHENITIEEGYSNTVILEVPKGATVMFYWVQGNWPNECSFTIYRNDQVVYTAYNGENFAGGEMVFMSKALEPVDPETAAVRIGDVYYATLVDAVAVVKDDDHIILLRDNDETGIVMNREVCFFVDGNGFGYLPFDCVVPGPCISRHVSGSPYEEYLAVHNFRYEHVVNFIPNYDGTHHGACDCGANNYSEACNYENGTCVLCGDAFQDSYVVAWLDTDNDGERDEGEAIFTTLFNAFCAVENATYEDQTVIRVCADVDLGDNSALYICAGEFTLDLNGKTISNSYEYGGPLNICGANVTIIDSDPEKSGMIFGEYVGLQVYDGGVALIKGGTISGGSYGLLVDDFGEVIISGGMISGDYIGVGVYDLSHAEITGGTISGSYKSLEISDAYGDVIGGSYSTDPSKYVTEGYAATEDPETGMWVVVEGSTPVAWLDTDNDGEIDEEEATFATLEDAFAAVEAATAEDKAVIRLYTDVYLNYTPLAINSGEFTLDLNGKTISCEVADYVLTVISGTVTITDSNQNGTISGNWGGVAVQSGTLILQGGTITAIYTVGLSGNSNMIMEGGRVEGYIAVSLNENASMTMADGTISGGAYGNSIRVYDDSSLTVTGGTMYKTIGIYGGTVLVEDCYVSDNASDAFFVHGGELTIRGGFMTGDACGVNCGSGSVTMEGGSIIGRVTGINACDSLIIRGGTIASNGIAVIVGGNTDAEGNITHSNVTIEGGDIFGNNCAVVVYEGNTATITGGTIRSNGQSLDVFENGIAAVTGGSFTQDPSAYLEEGYEAVLNAETGYFDVQEKASAGLTITVQPEDYVGMVGDTVKFVVAAEGEGLTYQWYYFDAAKDKWLKSSSTEAALAVEFKSYRNGQQYKCVITDVEGNSVESDVVSILAEEMELVIHEQPVSHVGAVNDNVLFYVGAEGNGLVYQWYYSTDGGENWMKSYSPGYDTNALEPILRAYRNGQQYYCEITDVFGNVVESNVVDMTVRSSEVVISKQPETVEYGVLNQLHYFTVEAEGDNLTYQWEVSMNGGETWEKSYNSGYDTAELTVRMYGYRSGYLYRCVITSGLQNVVITDEVALNLQPASVQIVSEPVSRGYVAQKNVNFHVEVEGMDLTYQWYRSNDGGNTWVKTYLDGYDTDTLYFKASASRCAVYRCIITDGSGKEAYSKAAKLTLIEKELVLLSQPESAVCANGEKVTFTTEADGVGMKYQWYASGDGGKTWSMTYLDGYDTNALSFTVTAARAAKLYKCIITDAGNNTVETDPVSVTMQ